MEFVKFTLSGNTAFFKKPEVNTYYYFTFGNIHKTALLGMFGAILGYCGYGQMSKADAFPEFYQRLKNIKVAIVPRVESKGYFFKKIQSFNNSVGYASTEQGGNLIIKQQWLENPSWEIFIKIEDEETEKLKKALLQKTCVYMPYLGNNDHPADIKDVEVVDGKVLEKMEEEQLHSLFPASYVKFEEEDDLEFLPFRYEEYLPVALEDETMLYQLEKFMYTNVYVKECRCKVYQVKDKNLVFF